MQRRGEEGLVRIMSDSDEGRARGLASKEERKLLDETVEKAKPGKGRTVRWSVRRVRDRRGDRWKGPGSGSGRDGEV